jgi:hypothetical protein
MTTELVKTDEGLDDKALLALVSGGDTARLNEQQKIAYYRGRCEAAGLDPRTAPLMFVRLSGKEVLYATKAATDQLASNHGVRTEILSQATDGGIRLVQVRATARDGRSTEEVGALSIEGLKGEALANALMKCVTKAKRRAVLSLCGLGMLDETEIETVPREREAPQKKSARPAVTVVDVDGPRASEAEEPPHDPETGEVLGASLQLPQVTFASAAETPEQVEARLIASLADGFRHAAHARAWAAKHKAEKDALPLEAQFRLTAAFQTAKAAAPTTKETP